MRILVVTDQWSPDVVGGSARVAADSARALAARGHEVVAIAPASSSLPVLEVESDSGVEVRRTLRRGALPQTFVDPVATARRARALRWRRFDVVLAHQATNAAGIAVARIGVPTAFVFHASAVLEARFLRRHASPATRAVLHGLDPALVLLERLALSRSAGVLVLSRFSEGLVRARAPWAAERVDVVGGGVPDAFFEEPPDPQSCRERLGIPPGTLLFTARRLEPRMGVELLLDALAKIEDERVILAVAGEGTLADGLERRVASMGLGDRVRLLGRVSETDLRALYAAADLFVLPTVAYEGFGMATVEALAAGTPALGTDVGATPEILGRLGPEFVASGPDAEALAGALRSVLPLLGPELRRRARSLAESRYRWAHAIADWERALERIAGVDASDRPANL